MLKRLSVILIILLITLNFTALTSHEPTDFEELTEREVSEEITEEEFGTQDDTPTTDPIKEPAGEPEPELVTLIKPEGSGAHNVVSVGTRGIWNVSGQPMFEDDFEGSFSANWFAYDNMSQLVNASSDFWGKNDTRAKNGSFSAYCSASNASGDPEPPGNNSVPGVNYDHSMYSWMVSGPFNLSNSTMLNVRLSFWYWLSSENASDGTNDSFYWAASKDNKSYIGYRISGNYSTWKYETYNLNDYDGQGGSLIGENEVWIAFVFRSNGTSEDGIAYEGAYVDDVKLENYTNRAPGKPTGLNVSGPNIRRVIDPKPVFNWTFNDPDGNVTEGQTGFHIQIGTDDNWGAVEKWNFNTSANPNSFVTYGSSNQLGDGETFWVRVKTRDIEGLWGQWSDSFNFSTNDPPSAPTVLRPIKDLLWEGGSVEAVNWTNSTNIDYGFNDTITINISYSINGGIDYTDDVSGLTNNGSFNWSVPNTVESSDCKVKLTAYDGYETASAVSPLFKIDSLPPVINDITVTSNKTWYYEVPGMNGTGGTVWFNSLLGEGAYQELLVTVDWTDVSPVRLDGALAFGDTPFDNDTAPYVLNYTVEMNATDNLSVKIKATDFYGRFTEATIDFKVDNIDPTAPSNVVVHPDSFTDTGEADDDNQVFVTYTSGSDADVGVALARLGTDDPPTQTENITDGRGLVTSYQANLNVTIYVAMVDYVGNVGPSANDTIKIDQLEPTTPDIFSSTHPDDNYFYSNSNPAFNWTWPPDLSGVTQFCVKLNTVSSYIPNPLIDSILLTNETSYSSISDGVNFFHVRSYDLVGHWSLGSSSFKIFIDTTAPQITDLTSGTGTTGEKFMFRAQSTDAGAGASTEAQVYWRYTGDAAFNMLNMDLVDDRFQSEITTDLNRVGSIEYYFVTEDLAILPNVGRYPFMGEASSLIIDDKDPIIISGTNSTSGTTGDPVTIKVKVSDNIKADQAYLYVEGWTSFFVMIEDAVVTNNFSTAITLPFDSIEPLKYYIEVYDAQNNMIRAPSIGFHTITVSDNDAPEVVFITGNISKRNEELVTITVLPEDNVETPLVLKAEFYSQRTDSLLSMVPVEAISGFQYEFELSSDIKFDVDYYVLVHDTAGNTMRSPADTTEFYHIYIPNLYKPNGGEIWNETQMMDWKVPTIPGTTYRVNLSYSTDSGVNWVSIEKGLKDETTYTWDTTELPDGTAYRVKLEVLFSNGVYCTDISDNDFVIYNPDQPVLTIKYPRTGDRIRGDYEISWEGNDPDPTDVLDVDIFYMQLTSLTNSSFNSEWRILVENREATGVYTWQTLKFNDGEYNLRFVVKDGTFTVIKELGKVVIYNPDPPLITVLSPKTNDVWTGNKAVTWIATDDDNEQLTINIYLRRAEDDNFTYLAEGLSNSGEYSIDFSRYPEGVYRVIVEAEDGSDLEPTMAESGVFDIVHDEGFDTATLAAISILIIVMAIILLLLFIMARNRRIASEKAKKKKEKKKKVEEALAKAGKGPMGPGGVPPGMGMPAMLGPGGPGQMPPQWPGGFPPGSGAGMGGAPPQLPESTETEGGTESESEAEGGEVEKPSSNESEEEMEPADAEVLAVGEDVTEGHLESNTDADIEKGEAEGKEPEEVSGAAFGDDLPFKAPPTAAGAAMGAPQQAPPPTRPPKRNFCGECGSTLGPGDVVCVSCGKFVK